MNIQDPSSGHNEKAVDHAKTLLGRLYLGNHADPSPSTAKNFEQLETARPEEFLTHLLEFYSFGGKYPKITEEQIVEAFKNGARDPFTYGKSGMDYHGKEREASLSVRRVAEFLTQILIGRPEVYLNDSSVTHNFIKSLRDECSPEDFQKNMLPLIRAFNKALAARRGVEGVGEDYNFLRKINGHKGENYNGGLGLCDYTSFERPAKYVKDLLEKYEKDEIRDDFNQGFLAKKNAVVPRLQAILARIQNIQSSTPEISNIHILIPALEKDFWVLKYDIETEVGLVEEQLTYFEQYIAERNRKKEAAAEADKKHQEYVKTSEVAEKLRRAETNIAGLLPLIEKMQGSGDRSVAFLRSQAAENNGRVHIARRKIQECFDEIEVLRPAFLPFSRDEKYITAACALIDPTIRLLQTLHEVDPVAIDWQKNFTPLDTRLPDNNITGEARLGVMEPMDARLVEQKKLLDAALKEADDVRRKLAPECDAMVLQLQRLQETVRRLLAVKSDEKIQFRVHEELETFRKQNTAIFA